MIVAQVYPNGKINVGYVYPKNGRKNNPNYDIRVRVTDFGKSYYIPSRQPPFDESLSPLTIPGQKYLNKHGEEYMVLQHYRGACSVTFKCVDGEVYLTTLTGHIAQYVERGELQPLGSSDVPILDSPPKSRKICSKISSRMRNRIANYVYLLEREHGKDLLSFLTLTLPPMEPSELSAIQSNWGKIVNRILKLIGEKLKRHGLQFQYVYVTEIQTKRAASTGLYFPHLHIVFRGRAARKSPWIITPKYVRQAWLRLVGHYAGRIIPSSSCENIQRLRKSACRYLAKYMSKGNCDNVTQSGELKLCDLRTQWGGCSRCLCKRLNQSIIRFTSNSSCPHIAIALAIHSERILSDYNCLSYFGVRYIPFGKHVSSPEIPGILCGTGCLKRDVDSGGLLDLIRAVDSLMLLIDI